MHPGILAIAVSHFTQSHTSIYEYIVLGLSSSLSLPSVAHQCIACTIALSNRSNHATVHPAGSTSHDAVNCLPHTHCKPAMLYTIRTSIL